MASSFFLSNATDPALERASIEDLKQELGEETTLAKHVRGHKRRDPIIVLRLNRIDAKLTLFGLILAFNTFVTLLSGGGPAWDALLQLIGMK